MRSPSLSLLLLCALPVSAQVDEQTRDHEERDRLYQQRRAEQRSRQQPVDAEARRESFLTRADELIRDRNYSSASGERYRVQTDDPRLRVGAAVRLLEAFRRYFDEFWPETVRLQPYEEVSRSFLFYSFYKFNRLLDGDFRFRTFRPKGHYRAELDAITMHTDAGGALADALVHEAAHQLVVQRLFGGQGSPPLWVSEGLATYFGFTRADDQGTFHRAAIGGKSAALFRDSTRDAGLERRNSLKLVRQGLRRSEKEAVGLVEVVVSLRDPNEFYGDLAPLNYATSWILVHFLLHADGGAHADAFHRFLELAREGRGGPADLYSEIDLTAEELQAAVSLHVKALKAR